VLLNKNIQPYALSDDGCRGVRSAEAEEGRLKGDIIKVHQAVQDAIPPVDSLSPSNNRITFMSHDHPNHDGCFILMMATTTRYCSALLFKKSPLLGFL
jgi:hypothetical protein